MYKIQTIPVLKLSKVLMSPRLLAGSAKKGDSKKESCEGDESKKKEAPKKDKCGRTMLPTSPRCKGKPGGKDDKSGDECKEN
ncbi:uncharacterized protein LOC108051509 [Drosophila rhopaloa]|uniref:Uncharacterized protein LOC108051509 n=1 Tax=Drosophila rhopaloa TaxID=1041015 RepID=A0A6P4FVB0_DRORH|nr:uncharacterized protein LOC108051509 [Drosophila rhopaloa]